MQHIIQFARVVIKGSSPYFIVMFWAVVPPIFNIPLYPGLIWYGIPIFCALVWGIYK